MNDNYVEASFTLGGIIVRVTTRPLETLGLQGTVDAVVSSDDSMLSMGGGVSAAIAGAAGAKVKAEVEHLLPASVGDVLVTSGGRLKASYILHAVTVDWANQVLPTPETIRRLGREVFRRCEALRISRVGVPALGTGAAGFPARDAAWLLVQALAEHIQQTTVLEEVHFAIDAEVFGMFEKTFRQFNVPHQRRPSSREETSGRSREPVLMESTEIASDVSLELAASSVSRRMESDRMEQWRQRVTLRATRPVIANRYVLLEELGRGGMGVVHLVWDLVLRSTFALKVLLYRGWSGNRDRATLRAMLQREAEIAIRLTHENIVRVHYFEPPVSGVGPFLVMEHMTWDSGDKWIADAGVRGVPARAVLSVGLNICRALEYAHRMGVLHGDVKPSNIFVDPSGTRAKLADFGLARLADRIRPEALLMKIAGTPDYMAPEQRSVGGALTAATDVYLLAATLWACAAGAPPGKTPAVGKGLEASRAHALRALLPALAADPAARPQSAAAFERLLLTAQEALPT
jgi:O-acetyl-ADP-ribose deacetylase (regulator of RNase III)